MQQEDKTLYALLRNHAEDISHTAVPEVPCGSEALEIIPIDRIRPNPYQPRKRFSEESLEELSRSIQQYGLLQPVNVRKISRDFYELIAGERRLKAARLAGFTHIRAFIQNSTDQESALLALVENLQREDLHFFEEAEGYLQLMQEHGLTQDELSKVIGKKQSTIANKIRIFRMSPAVKEMILSNNLSERHARALIRINNEQIQLQVLSVIIKKKLSVQLTDELVDQTLKKVYGEIPGQNANDLLRSPIRKSSCESDIRRMLLTMQKKGADLQYELQELDDKTVIHIEIRKD